ncbi:Putative heterokaryon incompatibility [Colletotrichum destructivum]|uniref:Heterokaryon incompatibility n=1 Tax=Colletotrichum destructivum TaxID=34406 RepID=A0AAX4ICJ1_9PEZI|nr:Putative heterokaryon incompatibility [Colletotrichum destructivum]
MDTNNQYRYSPLSGPRMTRLIRLHHSETKDAPLTCEMAEINVDDHPEYHALSYTWNDETPSVPMTVSASNDAGSGSQTLLLTPNCAAALRVLRKRVKRDHRVARTGLWVDAVCIDQSSRDEKSIQVAMMADVYRNAKVVVVWLGEGRAPPNRRSLLPLKLAGPLLSPPVYYLSLVLVATLGFDVSNKLGHKGEFHISATVIGLFHFRTPFLPLPIWPPSMYITRNKLLINIHTAPYWLRVWTLQEFANPSSSILCLNSALYPFSNLVAIFGGSSGQNMHSPTLTLHYRCFKPSRSPHAMSLPWNDILQKKATDPRDKVFALKELYPHILRGLTVDYNRTAQDIFTTATRLATQNTSSLGPLYYSDYLDGEWKYFYTYGRASREAVWAPSFSEDGLRMRLVGRQIGIVGSRLSQRIGRSVRSDELDARFCSLPDVIDQIAAVTDAEPDLAASQARLVSFGRLVSCTWDTEKEELAGYLRQMGDEHDTATLLGDIRKRMWRLASRPNHGRLFFTTDGRAGLGFHTLLPGDLVCVFGGLESPFIVREKGTGHVLVSPAMVEGAMSGEMWPENDDELRTWEIV